MFLKVLSARTQWSSICLVGWAVSKVHRSPKTLSLRDRHSRVWDNRSNNSGTRNTRTQGNTSTTYREDHTLLMPQRRCHGVDGGKERSVGQEKMCAWKRDRGQVSTPCSLHSQRKPGHPFSVIEKAQRPPFRKEPSANNLPKVSLLSNLSVALNADQHCLLRWTMRASTSASPAWNV